MFSLAPLYLDPFPVVRIRGSVRRRGANVSLLRVTGPPSRNGQDPLYRSPVPGKAPVATAGPPPRVRAIPTGRRPDHDPGPPAARVGKYVRFKVRAGKAPARRDACVVPGSSRPVACPPV